VEPPGAGQATEIFADVEFIGPTGKVLARMKKCCSATVRGAANMPYSLGPVVDLEIEPGDPTGTYTVKARVTDGSRFADASETFQYDGPGAQAAPAPADAKPERAQETKPAAKPAAAPVVRDIAPQAPRKAPGKGRDVSHCLGLPTPAEVIKCTEKAP
jgi:hypothetical protein